jgi:hypothetical protein
MSHRRIYQYDRKLKKVVEVTHREVVKGIPQYPILSDAAGVMPEQIPEQMAHDRAMGVPTHYTKDGRPILENRSHRRKYLRANGLYDRSAGYGDGSPLNR